MFLVDPMVRFPKHPMLLPGLQIKETDGMIIYGSPDGPFKINGKSSKRILYELLPMLKEKHTVEEIMDRSSFEPSTVLNTLEILFQKGCLVEYIDYENLDLIDKYYVHNISKNKNLTSLEDVYRRKEKLCLHLISFDDLLFRNITTVLEKYGFHVKRNGTINEDDWCIYISDKQPDDNLFTLSKKSKVLFFMINGNDIQVGPIFSEKNVLKNYYKINEKKEESTNLANDWDHHYMSNLVSMTVIREVLSFGSNELASGYITSHRDTKTESILHIDPQLENSIIDHYEAKIKFPATEFIHKSNNLSHYKSSNFKLGMQEYKSFLWKKTKHGELDDDLLKLFHFTVGFKENKLKKYSPSGGNINANLLFYVNLHEQHLEGLGIYYYNNVDGEFYKINNVSEDQIKKVIKYENKYRGLIIVGNDVDIISKKYGDFGFKVANLNSGVMLSQILSVNQDIKLHLDFLSHFDEIDILKMLGIKTTNEIVSFIIGVE
jgi:hypothetical protein